MLSFIGVPNIMLLHVKRCTLQQLDFFFSFELFGVGKIKYDQSAMVLFLQNFHFTETLYLSQGPRGMNGNAFMQYVWF